MTTTSPPVQPSGLSPLYRRPAERTTTPNIENILDRLDPDTLHPGRIAGPYAWHAWNLTAQHLTDELTLLIPHRDGPAAQRELLDRVETLLTSPTWRASDQPQCTRTEGSLNVRLGDGDYRIRVASYHWYVTDVAAPRPGHVVDHHGFPLVDEVTALRERLDHVRTVGPRNRDVTDLARWVQTQRDHAGRAPGAEAALHQLHRAAPETRETLAALIQHARRHYPEIRHAPGIDAAMQTIVDATATRNRPHPRVR